MAKKYHAKLSGLIAELNIESAVASPIEVRHFFSGAALYVNGIICASWSPVGLAFKLSEPEASRLIESGHAKPLKYFPKGYVKKGYALFDSPEMSESTRWKQYFLDATQKTI